MPVAPASSTEPPATLQSYHVIREKTVGLLKVSEQFFKGFKIAEVICPKNSTQFEENSDQNSAQTFSIENKVMISFEFSAGIEVVTDVKNCTGLEIT